MDSASRPTRRAFLTTAASGLAAMPLAAALRPPSPNRRIQHAAIGTGGMGVVDLDSISSHPEIEIVAICDVDTRRMAQAGTKFPNARKYQDWRELLDKEGDKVDSVNVTVPDHMHAAIAVTALGMGKHVYCQKPLTHDIHEARIVAAVTKRAGVVTQMGNQHSSGLGDRTATEWIRQGVIGKAEKVYLWSNKDPWKYRPLGPRPERSDPIPKELDWDGWIGTASMRPFVTDYHPTFWRGWQDFGCGWLGDMGCHIMDMPYRALGLGAPISVRADVEPEWYGDAGRKVETFPTWQVVRYTFPGTELTAGSTIDVTWSDGFKFPPPYLESLLEGKGWPKEGALVLGTDGVLLLRHAGEPMLFPQEKYRDVAPPDLEPWSHYHRYVDAILGASGATTQSPFEFAGPLAEAVLLGTIALRFPGQDLKWNDEAMKVENVADANRYVRRTYREGWEVPGL